MGSLAYVAAHANIYHEGRNVGRYKNKWVLATIDSDLKTIRVHISTTGTSWSEANNVTVDDAISAFALTADENLVHMAYVRASTYQLYYRSYNPVTDTFGAEELLNNVQTTRNVGIGVTSVGVIWVGWEQYRGVRGVYAICKLEGGWSYPELIKLDWYNEVSSFLIDEDNRPRYCFDRYLWTRLSGGLWTDTDLFPEDLDHHTDATKGYGGDLFYFAYNWIDYYFLKNLGYPYVGSWGFDLIYDDDDNIYGYCSGGLLFDDVVLAGFGAKAFEPSYQGYSFITQRYDGDAWESPELAKAAVNSSSQLTGLRSLIDEDNNSILFVLYWGANYATDSMYTYFIDESGNMPPRYSPEPKPLWRAERTPTTGRNPRNTGRNVRR